MSVRRLKKTIQVVLAGMGIVASSTSLAAALTVTDTQILTTNGQDFTFSFSSLLPSDGTGGTITVSNGISLSNPGTFDGIDLDSNGGQNEFFTVSVDGTSLGQYNCRGNGSNTLIAGCVVKDGFDSTFSLSLNLTSALLTSILADGAASISVNFSNNVNHFGDQDQLIVALSYTDDPFAAVPVPLSGLLLATGLVGFGAFRRRQG